MQRLVLATLMMVLLFPALLPAQEEAAGEMSDSAAVDTIPVLRDEFFGDADNHRNWGWLLSSASLQSTLFLAPELRGHVVVRRDELTDSLVVDMNIDLTQLTTCFAEKDSALLGESFLDFDTAQAAVFTLLSVSEAKEDILYNDEKVKVTGTGELNIGGVIDTVVAEMELTYLEENKVTSQRLPGDLLHLVLDYAFRLSDFGIRIPKEAILMLDDRMQVHADMFLAAPGD